MKQFGGRFIFLSAAGISDRSYFDIKNFAGYNIIEAPKQYLCVPTCGHAIWKEKIWMKKRAEWFHSLLGKD